jgi:alkyldihydroxyacetonephosphate synthase
VTNALDCNPQERRAIVSVDMGSMRRILRVDKENLLATVEAGVTGLDLHDRLALLGLTLGHEPDSWEFSTLGGWVATRASGMKKNRYGNIEDLVVSITAVTARGTLTRAADAPRVSMGPDVQEMLLGSEGTLGIVTEVTLRVSRVPQCQVYDSFIFPDFASGIAMLHEATRANCVPASLRLMDNTQFQLGQVLKPSNTAAPSTSLIDYAKKTYVTKVRGFQVDNMCAATVVMEGTRDEVAAQQATLHAIAKRHGGLAGGSENGKRGYYLTYLIAYLRDFALDYYFLSESFESSVPWSNARALCRDVKRAINDVAAAHGVIAPPLVACRISQVYATGVCVYVYYGVNYYGVSDPLSLFCATEKAAVDAMVTNGASLSHHHGIGKHRREWLEKAVSAPAIAVLHGVKRALDPNNVFATDNLLITSDDRQGSN